MIWGDESPPVQITSDTNNDLTHTYQEDGLKTVLIIGSITGIEIDDDDRPRIHEFIEAPHSQIKWTSLKGAFKDCPHLYELNLNDTSQVTDMSDMFRNATGFNRELNFNTENVEDMSYMFAKAKTYNKPITFKTTKVKSMKGMFSDATKFNQPLNFDLSNAEDISEMFKGAFNFNSATTFTNTGKLKNISYLFASAVDYNLPITFDTSSVENMKGMFLHAQKFNQEINFSTENVQDMSDMLASTVKFNNANLPLNLDAPQLLTIQGMLKGTAKFNVPVTITNTTKLTDLSWLFENTNVFDSAVVFNDLSSAETMQGMFKGAKKFNQPITLDTGHVTNMQAMFYGAKVFNQPLNFDTTKVTNMSKMFMEAENYNQDLSDWNVANVTNRTNFADRNIFEICHWPKFSGLSMPQECQANSSQQNEDDTENIVEDGSQENIDENIEENTEETHNENNDSRDSNICRDEDLWQTPDMQTQCQNQNNQQHTQPQLSTGTFAQAVINNSGVSNNPDQPCFDKCIWINGSNFGQDLNTQTFQEIELEFYSCVTGQSIGTIKKIAGPSVNPNAPHLITHGFEQDHGSDNSVNQTAKAVFQLGVGVQATVNIPGQEKSEKTKCLVPQNPIQINI